MPSGINKIGINSGRFQKGHHSKNEFKKGEHFERSKESYRLSTIAMVKTRKERGNYKQSEIHKKKHSDTMKLICQKPEERLRRHNTVLNLMATGRIKKFNTKPELKMKELLNALNIEYKFQIGLGGYMMDFYIPSKNLNIEVDGNYWHNYPDGTKKDRIRDIKLRERGYNVIRFWESDILKMNFITI